METTVLVDSIWIIFCALLVFVMQAGFLCIETGLTRSKNNINVAAKNLVDFFTGTLVFFFVGYGVMYGPSFGGYVGTPGNFLVEDDLFQHAFFFFQLMFATTAVTIVSGAIAERIRFKSYIFIAIIVSAIIYPIFGHWVWAGLEIGETLGWLGRMGFKDFAGGTVVHSMGGWVALALLIIIGPRIGRFDKNEDGSTQTINGSNLPFASLGVLLLLFGWFGFNGGSLLTLNAHVMEVIINTILGGCGGFIAIVLISTLRKEHISVYHIFNGILVGLVAITPGADVISHSASVVVGFVGGVLMLGSINLLNYYEIDDAIGALPVHLAGGVWGTLAVALFGDPELLATGLNFQNQLAVQALGIVVAGFWGFVPSYLIFSFVNYFFPMRVTPHQEEIGLNVTEHDASTELISFLSLLDYQVNSGDLSLRSPVEPFTEVGQIASRYNGVMNRLEDKQSQLSTVLSNAPLALFSTDIYGLITLIEGQFFNLLNIKPNESLYQIFKNDETSKQKILHIFEGQQRDWVTDLNGFHVYFRCQPIKDENGRITGLTGVASDITQQRESDIDREKYIDMLSTSARISEQITTILDSDELIETILPLLKKKYDLYHAAVLILDEESQTLKFAFGSDERSRQLSEKRESISLNHPSSLIARSARRKRIIVSNDVSLEPNYLPHPVLAETKSELVVPLMIHNQLIGILDIQENDLDRFGDSDVDLFASISRQISVAINNAQLFEKFQESESRLKTALSRAVESDKAKDEFLARVSHELRTPLGVILGYAEMIQDEVYGDVTEQQSERLDDIIQSSSHLTGLVNQLLDSAKHESGKIEPIFKTFDLHHLAKTVHQQMDALAKKKEISLHLKIDEEMDGLVHSDPTLIKQMMINLIGNAVKFTDKGFVQLELSDHGKDYFSLIVKDTGMGIPKEYQTKIFEPFQQVDGSKTRTHSGTGLGLTITKRMAEILGGEISLISIEGRGSQFKIILPVGNAPQPQVQVQEKVIRNKQKVPLADPKPVI